MTWAAKSRYTRRPTGRITALGRSKMRLIKAILFAASLALPPLAPAAVAQLVLPGAVGARPPAPEGGAAPAPAARKPIVLKTPAEESVLGRTLLRGGSAGTLSLERADGALALGRLALVGDRISAPGEQCRLEIEGMPLPTHPLGRPAGLARYAVELPACPFSFDVLDGAVLVERRPAACAFTAADCRVDPSGLWGPPAASFDAARIREMEHARLAAETTMRTNFRVLLAYAGKNRTEVKAIAAEQAGFSSAREEVCRDYAGESVNGFCALRITEARNHALLAKLEGAESDKAAKKPVRPVRKPPVVAKRAAAPQTP